MKDRFSKTCLGLIVVLLAVIALRPALTPQTVHAAPAKYEYAVATWNDFDIPVSTDAQKAFVKQLNAGVADGGELVDVVPITIGGKARTVITVWKYLN
jgi:hypothetical protein